MYLSIFSNVTLPYLILAIYLKKPRVPRPLCQAPAPADGKRKSGAAAGKLGASEPLPAPRVQSLGMKAASETHIYMCREVYMYVHIYIERCDYI